MKPNKTTKIFILFFVVKYSLMVHAQQIRVIDNKGTVKTANNNRVFRQNTDPNPASPTPTDPIITVEGDIWIDTSLSPNITKIWNGTTWENLSKIGTTGSVFFAGVSGGLEENNSQFFWNNNTPITGYHLSLGLRSGGGGTIANSRRTKLNVFGATTTTRGFVAKRNGDEVSYRFYNDTDTGMRRPTTSPITNNLSLVTNNTEAIRINAVQYVGLGINNPTSPLHIRRNLLDGIGIIRVEGREADINLNTTATGTYSTLTFERNSNAKALVGLRNDDALYIARRFGGAWYDNTFSVLNNNGFIGVNITTPTSRLHINGSVAKSIITTTTDLTLTAIHHTVIVAGNHNITLPAAGGCNGRIYIIKNRHNNSITCSAYKDEANADATTINSNTIIHLQSDGTHWQLIAKTPKNYAPVETKTGNYTLTAADNGKVINFNSGTAITLTVPVTLPVGFNISIYQMGAGEVTVIGSRENRLGRYKTAGQYAGAGIVTVATGTNILTGDLKL